MATLGVFAKVVDETQLSHADLYAKQTPDSSGVPIILPVAAMLTLGLIPDTGSWPTGETYSFSRPSSNPERYGIEIGYTYDCDWAVGAIGAFLVLNPDTHAQHLIDTLPRVRHHLALQILAQREELLRIAAGHLPNHADSDTSTTEPTDP